MGKKKKNSLVIIALILGFMFAIQYNSVNEPVARDTRDQWAIREALLKEKEVRSRLLGEIRTNEEKLTKYENTWDQSRELALQETLDELKEEIGLTEKKGHGLVIMIEPILGGMYPTFSEPSISPQLLQRLINEINMYGAKEVSVAGQRIVQTTVIRDINGETKIDGYPLRQFPLEIKIIAENEQTAERLYNRMQASQSIESFYIDNLKVNILQPRSNVIVPAYSGQINVRDMKAVKQDKGGSS